MTLCTQAARRTTALLGATALTLVLGLTALPAAPAGANGAPTWQPVASEKLVKLPGRYLRKKLDHDFAQSGLAAAIRDNGEAIALKARTLGELQGAVGEASGELEIELRHQMLAEKRAYLTMMGERRKLQKRHLESRAATLERVLDRLSREAGEMTPARAELVSAQQQARRRFESAAVKVDLAVLAAPAVPESRYARDYAENLTAIETLARAIERHPANADATAGVPMTKADLVRQMLADTEAGLALLDQEGAILGYMAKLVSLDAMALSERLMEAETPDTGDEPSVTPATAVRFFVN